VKGTPIVEYTLGQMTEMAKIVVERGVPVRGIQDKLFLLESVRFSYLTGNSEMHLKKFSTIKTASRWFLFHAYDLLDVSIVKSEDKDELLNLPRNFIHLFYRLIARIDYHRSVTSQMKGYTWMFDPGFAS
jgi:hypothetical protein